MIKPYYKIFKSEKHSFKIDLNNLKHSQPFLIKKYLKLSY